MLIAGSQPRGRAGALVVTAAAVLVLGTASTALARTSGAEAQSTVRPADLIPDASWHGRPIKQPDQTLIQVRRPVSSSVTIKQGAGLGRTGGSAAVRDVQRRLRALGYRTGPVDGAFGPRTQSSVAWFQIKHRLSPTGVVDGTTLSLLRFRTHGLPTASAPASVVVAPRPEAAYPTAVPALQPSPTRPPSPAPRSAPAVHQPHTTGLPLALLLVALGLALVVVAVLSTWLRSGARIPERAQLRKILRARAQATRVPARSSASRRGRSTGAVAAATNGNGGRQVIGYAVGRDERDFVRQQRAMERVCGERGWKLAALVKERDDGRRGRRRPGRRHVLSQVATGGVGQLIVGRLQSLAASPAELAVLLEWCRRRQVGLVALDVGLDTTTPDGRLAARCLGAVGTRAATATGAR